MKHRIVPTGKLVHIGDMILKEYICACGKTFKHHGLAAAHIRDTHLLYLKK